MYTLEDQVDALTTAAFHLEQGGTLPFDVFYPKFEAIPKGMGQEILELECAVPSDPAKVVRRYFRKESYDKINQTFRLTFIFRTFVGSELVSEETEPLTMSYYTYPQAQRPVPIGWVVEPVAEYGSFAKTLLDNNAEQMIFLLRAAS